ncbi:MAG: hypothetical protein GXO42_01780 [bacterium]|nr:hypothetical protein [bacterium]
MQVEKLLDFFSKQPAVLAVVVILAFMVLGFAVWWLYFLAYAVLAVLAYFLYCILAAHLSARSWEDYLHQHFSVLLLLLLVCGILGALAYCYYPLGVLASLLLELLLVPLLLALFEYSATKARGLAEFVRLHVEQYYEKLFSNKELLVIYVILVFTTIFCPALGLFFYALALPYILAEELGL